MILLLTLNIRISSFLKLSEVGMHGDSANYLSLKFPKNPWRKLWAMLIPRALLVKNLIFSEVSGHYTVKRQEINAYPDNSKVLPYCFTQNNFLEPPWKATSERAGENKADW